MKHNRNRLYQAMNLALPAFVTAGLMMSTAPVMAQDEDSAELDELEVTGSRIKRVDLETSTPVTVINREQIEAAGDSTVAELLRSSTFNSFGSFRDQSGFGSGFVGVAQVSLRGLGSQRTLVLLDGRRFGTIPGSGAASVNLNQIPIDIVERVEILRDGASAIYGSDAIAGVVNVITRKDIDGATLTIQAEDPEVDNGEAERISLAGGMSSSNGNLTFGIEHFEREPIFDRDFPEFAVAPDSFGISSFGFPGSYIILGGDLAGGNYVDPRCPLNVGDSALFPNSYRWTLSTGLAGNSNPGETRCGYNFANDTILFPETERNAGFVNANYELTDNINLVSRMLISQNETRGRFAGAPITTPFPTISADNPNNPINILIDQGDATEDDLAPVLVLARTVPSGNRDSYVKDNSFDWFAGLEGVLDLFGGSDWSVGAQYIRNTVDGFTYNLANKRTLQNAIDNGSLDFFNVQGLSNEEWLQNTSDVFANARHTGVFQAETEYTLLDGSFSWDLFQTANGPVPIVIGAEYYELDFSQENDPESNQLIIAGTSGGDNIAGVGRDVTSFYAESIVPLPGNIDVNLAGRYDDYSDFGSTFNPKVSVGWRPTDAWLVRASYGEGFRAPSMTELYGNQSESFPPAVDLVGCANGVASCNPTQYRAFFGGNPDLEAEESESINFGVVWNPLDQLSFELSYYDIEFDNQITTISLQRAFQLEQDGFANPVVRNNDGTVNFVSLTNQNLSGVQTDGLDFNATYGFDTDGMGRFNFQLDVSHVLSYETEGAPGDGFDDILDSNGIPETRANLLVNWALANWEASWVTNYISANGGADIDTFGSENGSHVTHDVQLAYFLPWDAQIAVGARNVFDEFPPTNANFYGWQPVDFGLYDPQGRITYVRYKQNF